MMCMTQTQWCTCSQFVYWYTAEDGTPIRVCECGHPDHEHVDGAGMCVGDVIRT